MDDARASETYSVRSIADGPRLSSRVEDGCLIPQQRPSGEARHDRDFLGAENDEAPWYLVRWSGRLGKSAGRFMPGAADPI